MRRSGLNHGSISLVGQPAKFLDDLVGEAVGGSDFGKFVFREWDVNKFQNSSKISYLEACLGWPKIF